YFGFQVGEWHLRPDQIVGYLTLLAEESDKVEIQEYARSHEQRPLVLLTISSARNISNIESIREQHVQLTDAGNSANLNTAEMPSVVWMGYSIHGNESSGSNASVLVAYHLAAAQDSDLESTLDEVVVLLDPCFNPDGLARFAHWANMHKGQNLVADSDHREHREGWPSGRTNHYWYDLNRDWLLVQHPESQGRIRMFHHWKPNILTDHHEMGTNSTYFMQPGVQSRTNPLTPALNQELTKEIAVYHADALDDIGSLYYTQETFDDFYYGKGSTYPDINGTIGILFEQASARGHLQESIHGDVSFPFTIRNQVATSFSTLKAGREMREQLLNYQRDFYQNAMQEATDSDVKAYLFRAPDDMSRATQFIRLLQNHSITVHKLGQNVSINGQSFSPDDSFIIPLEQRQHRLIDAMFETRTSFPDSIFYDVSTWTMPLAFHLDYAPYTARNLDQNILGEAAQSDLMQGRLISDTEQPYAYLMKWDNYFAPRALNRILSSGIRAKVSSQEFNMPVEGASGGFSYGTILFPTDIQRPDKALLDSLVQVITTEDGVDIYGVGTGLTPRGIDLGSPSFSNVIEPRVLIAVGGGISAYEAGEMWHLLDVRQGMAPSLIEKDRLDNIDMDDYTVMIFPSGGYGDLSEGTVKDIDEWVSSGGTLITLGYASRWAVNNEITTGKFIKAPEDSITERRNYVTASNFYGAQVIGGAIFEAQIDVTHPLGYGYRQPSIPLFRQSTLFMNRTESPYKTPLQYSGSPLLSGYISDENLDRMSGSAAVIAQDKGAGSVIMILDRLSFRGFWYGTNKVLMNAIFFGSIL
ncbi:MAG: zinc carboxypeptidase, partial [Candidatus Marinimicrobia bacterium]|nr:zinc carboxypeptidase [Candidatus Neomarinimicrobiota bacterium]